MGEMGEKGQKVEISSYKMSKSWGCNVQHGDYSQEYCIVYLKVARGVDLKSSHHQKKKIVIVHGDRC